MCEVILLNAMNSSRATHSQAEGKEIAPAGAAQTKLPVADVCDADCLLTKKELAQRLKKSVRSIENWMKLRYLPYIKIGHSVLFRWRDVVEALDHFHVK
jgi:hypothetical protein